MNIIVTKERVLEAIEKNPNAKEVLTTLFPEVFNPFKIIPASDHGYKDLKGYNIAWWDERVKKIFVFNKPEVTGFSWEIEHGGEYIYLKQKISNERKEVR